MKLLALRDKVSGKYHTRSGSFSLTDNPDSIGYYADLRNLSLHLARVSKSINYWLRYNKDYIQRTIELMNNSEIVEFELIPKTIDPLESQDFIQQKCLAKVKQ